MWAKWERHQTNVRIDLKLLQTSLMTLSVDIGAINSTSTWVGDCNKNISKLRQVSDEHDDHDTQYVDATVHTTPDEHFRYLLKSASGRPYIRFTVPGKTKVQ